MIAAARIRLEYIFFAYMFRFAREVLSGYLRGVGVSFIPGSLCSRRDLRRAACMDFHCVPAGAVLCDDHAGVSALPVAVHIRKAFYTVLQIMLKKM